MAEGPRLVVGLLGPVEIRVADQWHGLAQRGLRILLATLAAAPNRVVTVSALIEALWQEEPSRQRERNLTVQIYQLRQRLKQLAPPEEIPPIITQPPGYRLALNADQLDISIFTATAAQGRTAAAAGDQMLAGDLFRRALELWRGPALADVADHSPQLAAIAASLEERRLAVVEDRIDADLASGRHDDVVAELTTLVVSYPLRERFWGQLMLALYRCHRQAEALATYRQARLHLADELGLDPGPALRALHQRILQADPALGAPTARPDETRAASGLPSDAADDGRSRSAESGRRQLPPGPRYFAGRTDELKELNESLDKMGSAGGTAVVVAIGGSAGIGKTALALHWAHNVARRFSDGQLFMNLRGSDAGSAPLTSDEAIQAFLEVLGTPAPRMPATAEGRAALYRAVLADQRMLIVLDNAADPAQVRPLLPASPGSVVLVTSRRSLAGLVVADGATPVTLGLPSADDAAAMLGARLGPERLAQDPHAVSEIIGLCARLPLALAAAAARVATEPGRPLAALATELSDQRGRLLALDTGEQATSVRAVLSWSYGRLARPAARMFRLLAAHPGPDISIHAAASLAAVSAREARRTLGELTTSSMLIESGPGRYAFQDLLQAYAADRAQEEEAASDLRAASQRMLDHYVHSAWAVVELEKFYTPFVPDPPLPGVVPEDLTAPGDAQAWLLAEHPVLLAAISQAADLGFGSHAVLIATALLCFQYRQGFWTDGATVSTTVLAAAERHGDPRSLGAAHSYAGLIATFGGLFDQAIDHFQQADAALDRCGDQNGRAFAHANISVMLTLQGQHAAALEYAQTALRLSAGTRTWIEAFALTCVGRSVSLLGDHAQALASLQQAVALFRQLGSTETLALALDYLGFAQAGLGDDAAAVASYAEAIRLFEEIGNRWGQADTLIRLGDSYEAAADHVAARRAWQSAVDTLGDQFHPEVDRTRAKLGQFPG